jgi:hypothetical protein
MNAGSTVRRARKVRGRAIASLCCLVLPAALALGAAHVVRAAGGSPVPAPRQLFGIHPAQEGRTTLPGGHFNFALVPGQAISDGVVIENLSEHALSFHVYGADLLTAAGGGLAPAQAGATMHAVGAWITVSAPLVAIAAGGEYTDTFTLRVPAVAPSGQHLGAVVVSADVGITSQGSPIEARAALITVVTVPGVAHASATLTPLTGASAPTGAMRFGITLLNAGNVLLTYAGSVAIVADGGRRIGVLDLTPTSAYVVPGGEVPLSAVWSGNAAPSGDYRAQATVTILDDGSPAGTLASQQLTFQLASGIPALVIAALAGSILVIVVLAAWLARRPLRRRSGKSAARGARARVPHVTPSAQLEPRGRS